MAKKQSFADKANKKSFASTCPVCKDAIQYIRHVKAVKTEVGAWKFNSRNTGVCKCNHEEVYG